MAMYLAISVIPVHSQDKEPLYRHYTTNDGLPSSEVYRVIQDKEGYMWFATDNGVSRFNGYEFENYGIPEGLEDVVALDMKLDDEGTIWVRTLSNKFYYLNRFSNKFQSFEFNSIIIKYAPFVNDLSDFYFSSQDRQLVVGITDLGFLKIDSIGTYSLQSNKCEEGCLEILNNGKIAILNFKTKDLGESNEIKKKKPPIRYKAFILKDSTVLVSYDNNRLIQFSENKIIDSSSHTLLHRIYEDDRGNIFEFGIKNGIRLYKKPTDLIHESNVINFFHQHYVTDIHKDNNDMYWITTLYQGVIMVPNIENVKIFPSDDNSEIVRYILKSQNYLWLINEDFIIFRSPIKTPLFKTVPGLSQQRATTLSYQERFNSLIVRDNHGDYIFNLNDGILDKFQLLHDSVYNENLIDIESNDKILLMGRRTWFVVDVKNLTQKVSLNITFPGRGQCLYRDTKGNIWVGTILGLYLYLNNNLIEQVISQENRNLRIEELLQLPDGRMVAATKGAGIIIWDDRDTLQITQADGLTTDMVENIQLDSKNNLWVGTLSGANRISFTSDTSYIIDQYTTRLGLPSNEINRIASSDDKVYLATNGGLIELINVDQPSYSISPSIVSVSSLYQQYSVSDDISLPFDHNDITISYITLDYLMNASIDYRYRINSSDWHMTKSREISLLNLSPKKYNIEIQSKNSHNQWSQPAYASFTIHPAWWNTWWARLLAGSTILFVLYSIYRSKINQLKKEKNLLEEINEMERSALNAQMNPHFIFNCLNSIQSFIINNDKEKASEYLSKFAKLVRSVLNSSQNQKVTLSEEISMLDNYLKLEQMRFKNALQYSIKSDKSINTITTKIPSLLIQPILENAIVHGIQNTSKSGNIMVEFIKLSESQIKITIEDNGPGMVSKNHLSNQKSAALKITRRRLQLMNKNKDVNSLELENIIENDKIKGTRATMIITT